MYWPATVTLARTLAWVFMGALYAFGAAAMLAH